MQWTAQRFFSNGGSARGGIARGMCTRQFVGIICAFWCYVTLSDVVYAHGVSSGIAHVTTAEVFASWDVRVLQHLLLLPALMVSFWASLIVEWRPLWLALPIQLALAGAFAAIAYPAMALSQLLIGLGRHAPNEMAGNLTSIWSDPSLQSLWLASFVTFLPAYGFGLALVRSVLLYTRFRDSELQLADLAREWSAARLAALRMQLSPHTLFNLLHTIRGNIEWDPRGAQAMVVQLADLLRRLLSAGEREFSKLSDELQFVAMYLELQQKRFPDRLRLVTPDAARVPGVWVPSLILQPLVENAVVHGLAGHQGPVTVTLDASVSGDVVTLSVANTAVGQPRAGLDGIGLKNVRERLAVQFGSRGTLQAGIQDDIWRATIQMPSILAAPPSLGVRDLVTP